MSPRKRRRLSLLGLMVLALAGATALVLNAFEDNVVFFYAPSELHAEIAAERLPEGRNLRLGGLVAEGSFVAVDGTSYRFDVTDGAATIPVHYEGLLPDLFREGQGVVAQGEMNGAGVFQAREVLARHDENYMPAEVADALERAGYLGHDQKGEEPAYAPASEGAESR